MLSIVKGMFKTAAIGTAVLAVAAGGAALIAGPARARAVAETVHERVLSSIDSAIDDPVALRKQLIHLKEEYPRRISAVREDLSELEGQMRQLERDKSISNRVIELAQLDLSELEPKLEAAAAQAAKSGTTRLAAIATDEAVMSFNAASTKIRQLRQLVHAHKSRSADADHDLVYLRQQAQRFTALLEQLEGERAQFQTQLFQLDRQVDAIQRNQRLIELLEKRERTLEEVSSFDIASLEQITGRLSMIRSQQEAELDHLTAGGEAIDYEELARVQLESERAVEIDAGSAAAHSGQLIRVR